MPISSAGYKPAVSIGGAYDMPQYGVLVHGPESPGFRERLLSLFRDSPFGAPPELDDDELPCSFIIENQTLSHIVEITFICSLYPRESGPSFSLQSGDSRNRVLNDQWGSMIKPGGQCPWSLLDGYWFISQKVVSTTGEDTRRERRDQEKKKFAAIDKLSVEIDGVLFSDGSFVGPDTELKLARQPTISPTPRRSKSKSRACDPAFLFDGNQSKVSGASRP